MKIYLSILSIAVLVLAYTSFDLYERNTIEQNTILTSEDHETKDIYALKQDIQRKQREIKSLQRDDELVKRVLLELIDSLKDADKQTPSKQDNTFSRTDAR